MHQVVVKQQSLNKQWAISEAKVLDYLWKWWYARSKIYSLSFISTKSFQLLGSWLVYCFPCEHNLFSFVFCSNDWKQIILLGWFSVLIWQLIKLIWILHLLFTQELLFDYFPNLTFFRKNMVKKIRRKILLLRIFWFQDKEIDNNVKLKIDEMQIWCQCVY